MGASGSFCADCAAALAVAKGNSHLGTNSVGGALPPVKSLNAPFQGAEPPCPSLRAIISLRAANCPARWVSWVLTPIDAGNVPSCQPMGMPPPGHDGPPTVVRKA